MSAMQTSACPICGCGDPHGAAAHAILAALAEDDIDRAMTLGLLEQPPCLACAPTCAAALVQARDARASALHARDRYRARNARLQRRAEELKAKRTVATAEVGPKPGALPTAAAAALARAKAKAAGNPPK